MTERRYELVDDPEYWDLTLKDGSSLTFLANAYSLKAGDLVFDLVFKGKPNLLIESFRIPVSATEDDWSHWNGDSYDFLREIADEIVSGGVSISESVCHYCDKTNVLNFYIEGRPGEIGSSRLWCNYCWHDLEQEVVVPDGWTNSSFIDLKNPPETPRVFLESRRG